jgi:DNA-binding winged helix-turn-helix (wHTH) protein
MPLNTNAMAGSFLIDEWLIVPEQNRIQRNGESIEIEPKMMSVLELLAREPGAVVTRDDLHRSIWGDVLVTDDALNRCITQLRRALADDARQPRFIETISKKGYRLIAHVSRSIAAEPGLPDRPFHADVVVTNVSLLGQHARIILHGVGAEAWREIAENFVPDTSRRMARLSITDGTQVLFGAQTDGGDTSTTALTVRTRSYRAAAPLSLSFLSFVVSALLLYGKGFGTGTVVGLVILATVLGWLGGNRIRAKVLADARLALVSFASALEARAVGNCARPL